MDDEIDLDYLRSMIKRGAVGVLSPGEGPPMSESVVIFDDVSPGTVRSRRVASTDGDIGGEWFLVTDRPRGREWIDDVAEIGLFVIEVEDLAKARSSLCV